MSVNMGVKIPNAMISAALGDAYYNQGNAMLRMLQALVQCNVKSMTLTAPPGSPADGDTYVIAGSPTGAWSGKANQIAYWSADPTVTTPAWEFYVPADGWLIGNQADHLSYRYSGSAWVTISTPMTTAGDIAIENATPAPARLAIGSTGQVLTVVAGLPAWAASAGSAAGNNNYDRGPASPSALDDEFDSSTLDAKWTVTTNTVASHDVDTTTRGALSAKFSASSTQLLVLSQPWVPGSGDVSVTVKVLLRPTSDYESVGVAIGDTASDQPTNGILAVLGNKGYLAAASVYATKQVAAASTDLGNAGTLPITGTTAYIHLQRVSGTWTFWVSFGGGDWFPVTLSSSPSFTIGHLNIFMANYSASTGAKRMAIDYVRVNAFTL